MLRAAAADRDAIGVDDARIGGAQSGQVSIESFSYTPVAGKQLPIVLTHGRMPRRPGEIALAPVTAHELHAVTGSTVRLTGDSTPRVVRVTGIAFVPAGPHNGYADGAWLTPAGYDPIFAGAHYSFKLHAAAVALRPPVTGDDVEPHTLPAGPVRPRPEVISGRARELPPAVVRVKRQRRRQCA